MLGYEPSRVTSRLFLADYSRCAFDLGITPRQFLEEHNPMYDRGEQELAPYVTEVRQAGAGHAQVLLINNNSLPFAGDGTNPLGVLAQGRGPQPHGHGTAAGQLGPARGGGAIVPRRGQPGRAAGVRPHRPDQPESVLIPDPVQVIGWSFRSRPELPEQATGRDIGNQHNS